MRRTVFVLAGILCAATAQPPAFTGLPPLENLAVSPQGGLFATTGAQSGLVIQVFGNRTWNVLARTGGQPRGLAFDASGDLYVADRALGRILRVTPWGHTTLAADRCGGEPLIAPAAVAATSGAVYFTDTGTSRVCRLATQPDATPLAAGLDAPIGLAAGAHLYVASLDGTIQRVSLDGRVKQPFARLTEGRPAGLALDRDGNLYAALRGAAKVAVLDPGGHPVRTIPLPAPNPVQSAFGGPGLRTLFVADASGAIVQFPQTRRAALQPWEPDPPIAIVNPPDGAILNHHDGQRTPEGLRIAVTGITRLPGPLRLNGATVPVTQGRFEASVTLKERRTQIVVEGPTGARQQATYLWDRDSFPRYRFSTDDNIRFLEDIARNSARYQSIFENPYLAMWRELHRKYGTKIHHNLYYQSETFDLSRMPDKFRAEWRANSDWMRLNFHALANDPDRPYVSASAEQILRDYRLVVREIRRFAGPEALHPVTTVHWGETTLEAARALRREGIRTLAGYFEVRNGLPAVGYYANIHQLRYLMGRDYWYDPREDITFVRHDIVVNSVPLAAIDSYLDRIAADPHQSEIMELMIHEQYFYPDYVSYEPDYRQRVERAIAWVTKHGYKPVFYEDGFLGAEPR